MPDEKLISLSDIACCPELSPEPCCDRKTLRYRLDYDLADAPMELIFEVELERCPGPLSLGDVAWSSTLLPGEKVRLRTSSRRTRFTYDSETDVSYSHEQTSEETYFMENWGNSMTDLTVTDNSNGSSKSDGSASTSAGTSSPLLAPILGGDVSAKGSYNASSSFDFFREISRLGESSYQNAVNATRNVNSVSIGEVHSRSHAEGESESSYEAATRIIENKNECHAVTYFAYQLVKKQTLRLKVKSVIRRLKDPVGVTQITTRSQIASSGVDLVAGGVLSTSAKRQEIQTNGKLASLAVSGDFAAAGANSFSRVSSFASPLRGKPIDDATRAQALKRVDAELQKARILDANGNVSKELRAELEFEVVTCLPTTAVVVKGCIDSCNVCEDTRQRGMELDLERKALENALLAKQIELLEKSQDYRCCPVGEEEPAPVDG